MIRFLDVDEVLAIHASRIDRHGGSVGVRDATLLESAVAMPQASMYGELLHATLHEQAAAYLYHLAQNHPFVDGNKRTALATALAFLALNGIWIESTDEELVDLTVGIAGGRTPKSEAAVFFRGHASPWSP